MRTFWDVFLELSPRRRVLVSFLLCIVHVEVFLIKTGELHELTEVDHLVSLVITPSQNSFNVFLLGCVLRLLKEVNEIFNRYFLLVFRYLLKGLLLREVFCLQNLSLDLIPLFQMIQLKFYVLSHQLSNLVNKRLIFLVCLRLASSVSYIPQNLIRCWHE